MRIPPDVISLVDGLAAHPLFVLGFLRVGLLLHHIDLNIIQGY